MKPLVPQCLIGHKFVRVDEDKNYFLCCRSPIIGNYDTDGSFKEFWKSDKYNNLRKRLKRNLLRMKPGIGIALFLQVFYIKNINLDNGIFQYWPRHQIKMLSVNLN